ncbi:hypothetical protein B5180_05410 [Streptomyces sp. BF-3]|nr:hypothetical protein B5180_05410 [Streptomyces sp. BF-3]
MSQERTAVTWLGIAGGTLAILAFLGVSNLDDLKAAFDPDADSRKACTKAWGAWDDYKETGRAILERPYEARQLHEVAAGKAYSDQLSRASELTDEDDLKTALRDHSDVEKRIAEYGQQTGDTLPGAGPRRVKALNAWDKLCREYFSDD